MMTPCAAKPSSSASRLKLDVTARSPQREELCWKGSVEGQWLYTHECQRAKKLIPDNKPYGIQRTWKALSKRAVTQGAEEGTVEVGSWSAAGQWIEGGVVLAVLLWMFCLQVQSVKKEKERKAKEPDLLLHCTDCGTLSPGKQLIRGSALMELALWFCFLAPGMLYSIWRRQDKPVRCLGCGGSSLIPENSPRAKAEIASMKERSRES